MSVCEFVERDGVELLVYRLISIIIATRTWIEIHAFGNDFYQSRLVAKAETANVIAIMAKQVPINPQLIGS